MVFVAVAVAALGLLVLGGFVVLHLKLGALGDELRDARQRDALDLSVQLDGIADKQQGTRHDLERMTKRIGELALHIEGPPSMRHPTLPPVSGPTPRPSSNRQTRKP